MQPETLQQPSAQGPPPARAALRRYRSLFWAVVLLGVGIYALLFNLDVIEPASLGMLTYVWPLVIIGAAVDLIIGRRSLVAGALVGLVTVGVMIALMLAGPITLVQFYLQRFTYGHTGRASAIAILLLLACVPVMVYNLRQFSERKAF